MLTPLARSQFFASDGDFSEHINRSIFVQVRSILADFSFLMSEKCPFAALR